jgi:hypothetical protein
MVPVILALHLRAIEDMLQQFNLDLVLIDPRCFWFTYVNSSVCWKYIVSAR